MAMKVRAAGLLLLLSFCLSCVVFVPAPRHVGPVAAGALGMMAAAPAYADKIDDAAKVLSEKSYPFLKEIDWTSDVYAKLPTQKPVAVMEAINKMLVMGAAMDSEALKKGVLAHAKAIDGMDSKLVATLDDYTAINSAIGHMIASVPASKTMGVYNAFAKFSLGSDVGPYMMSKVNAADAKAAYEALLAFKDVVKASQR
uniref:Chloroplast soluble peridinin-chlorophyll a-binding protein n=1 Tax=Symbiodinium muscatinei TaxID=128924 RepID=G9I8P7_SYMMU|nr:chloroplast soluble peridinin-chlorophyll a-binding protein precursor [Symbiodinium muscatinei]